MKQFNLEEYLKNPSRKVVTRDGRSVRIICTDRVSEKGYPLVALVMKDGHELVHTYIGMDIFIQATLITI